MATADASEGTPAQASPDPGAVGLIGLGEIGQVHAAAVRQSAAARLVAVADTVPELVAPFETQGVRGYAGASELIADPRVGTVCGAAALDTMRLLDRIYDTATILPAAG